MVETEILAMKYFYQKIPEFDRGFFHLSEWFSAHFLPQTKLQFSCVNTGFTDAVEIPQVNLSMSVSIPFSSVTEVTQPS